MSNLKVGQIEAVRLTDHQYIIQHENEVNIGEFARIEDGFFLLLV